MLRNSLIAAATVLSAMACTNSASASQQGPWPDSLINDPQTGSVIFIHPDGTSVAAWGAARLLIVGPDGQLNWDTMERIGVYRGHLSNSLASTSNGAATAHAYGVKVPHQFYGAQSAEPLLSLSGKPLTVMQEAQEAGLATALINTGHLAEPGTGVFVASADARANVDAITRQIIESGTEIILGGGEALLLPPESVGRHGVPGIRRDGLDLIQRAEELGYLVVYTKDELFAVPHSTDKVLGVFAPAHTFYDRTEQELRLYGGGPLYHASAPTVAEMLEVALGILETKGQRFLAVVEEEGTDNFGNVNNATGMLAALARADSAIGVALRYVERNPNTLVITTADSDAGGPQVVAIKDTAAFYLPVDLIAPNGAPLDGIEGPGSLPFLAMPDQFGVRHWFGIAWAETDDLMGGIVARAHGLNAELLPSTVDNTDIYRMIYATVFGEWLP